MARAHKALFLCTGNSARSILAEAVLNHRAQGRFIAYSAGSHPAGRVNPWALETLRGAGIPTDGLRSKAWDEFSLEGAPTLDFVITVCDHAAGEACPIWPGHPATAHWGLPDPAAVDGSDEAKRRAFAATMATLLRRVELMVALPPEKLELAAAAQSLREIAEAAPFA